MNILTQLKKIKAFVLDVDGVLTDGFVYPMQNGEQVRRFNIKDGYALQLAVKKGYHVIIISGANEMSVLLRLQKLGIEKIHLGVKSKAEMVGNYLQSLGLNREELLVMGDDIPDYTAMKLAGIASCPADAVGEIKVIAHYISSYNGGYGCVRDVIEKVLKLNHHWDDESSIAAV